MLHVTFWGQRLPRVIPADSAHAECSICLLHCTQLLATLQQYVYRREIASLFPVQDTEVQARQSHELYAD